MLFPLYPSVGCVSARDIPRWSVPISQGLCQRFELEGDDGVLARRVLGGIWTVFCVGLLVIYQPDGFDDVWCLIFFPDVGCSSVVYMIYMFFFHDLSSPRHARGRDRSHWDLCGRAQAAGFSLWMFGHLTPKLCMGLVYNAYYIYIYIL